MNKTAITRFFFPDITARYVLRLAAVAAVAFILFKYVFIPFRIQGESMAPTYVTGSFNFCFALRYMFASPAPPDVVTVRMAGQRIMLLKRVVAVSGQRVEFRKGFFSWTTKKLMNPTSRKKVTGSLNLLSSNRITCMLWETIAQCLLKRIPSDRRRSAVSWECRYGKKKISGNGIDSCCGFCGVFIIFC
jgi:signal peptidase I